MKTPIKLLLWLLILTPLYYAFFCQKPSYGAVRGSKPPSTANATANAAEVRPTSTLPMGGILGERRTVRISHYGWTGNKMANGLWPTRGFVASSDRTIPLGTKIFMETKQLCGIFEVGDRTAIWVGKELGDTIDIYLNLPKEKLLELGTYKTIAYIIK